jgi:PAS domain-containing protein
MAIQTPPFPSARKTATRDLESGCEAKGPGLPPMRLSGVTAEEHAAYLQALSENNPLGIVVLDPNSRVQMCNPAFERLFGYRIPDILGADLDSLLSPAWSMCT